MVHWRTQWTDCLSSTVKPHSTRATRQAQHLQRCIGHRTYEAPQQQPLHQTSTSRSCNRMRSEVFSYVHFKSTIRPNDDPS
eukprot:4490056-Amphidinium_carterae.2